MTHQCMAPDGSIRVGVAVFCQFRYTLVPGKRPVADPGVVLLSFFKCLGPLFLTVVFISSFSLTISIQTIGQPTTVLALGSR